MADIILPRKGRETPQNFARRWITQKTSLDQEGLSINYINERKGYGVFAKRSFKKNEFLAEYVGDLINAKEADKREQVYARRNKRRKYPRCYMFFVKHNEMTWCIDATNVSGRVGSMVNDSCTEARANSKVKKLLVDGNLHLAIFATRDIKINEELLYDYGDDSQNYWWRMPMMTAKCSIDLLETVMDASPSPCIDYDTPQLAQDRSAKKDLLETVLDASPSPCIDYDTPQLAQDRSAKKDLLETVMDASPSPCIDYDTPQLAQDRSAKKEENRDLLETVLDASPSPCIDYDTPQLAQDTSAKKENTDLLETVMDASPSPCIDYDTPQLAQDRSAKKDLLETVMDASPSPCIDYDTPQLAQDRSAKKDLLETVMDASPSPCIDYDTPQLAQDRSAKKDLLETVMDASPSPCIDYDTPQLAQDRSAKKDLLETVMDASPSPCIDYDTPQLAQDRSAKKDLLETVMDASPSPCIDYDTPQLAQDRSAKKDLLETVLDASPSPCINYDTPQLAQDRSAKKVENTDLLETVMDASPSPCIDYDTPQLAQDRSAKKDFLETVMDASPSPCIDYDTPQLAQDRSAKKDLFETVLDASPSPCIDYDTPQLAQDRSAKKVHQCLSCGNAYNRKINLQRHIETCHKENDDDQNESPCDLDSDQEYIPDMCTDDESDEEYVPDSESDDDDYDDDRDSNCSLIIPPLGQSMKHCSQDDEVVIQASQISSSGTSARQSMKHCSQDDEVVIQASQISSSGTSAILVSSTKNETGKRIWDKRNACLYCSLLATNIGRHLIRKHSSEAMVAKALIQAKKTKYRQKEFERIRHLGNFYHNAKVLTLKVGTLLVVKRPPKNVEVAAEDYAPCIFCKGFFIAVELWRHYRECKFQEDDISKFESGCNQKGGLRASRMLKESLSLEKKEDTNSFLFDTMRMDSVGIICKTDNTISELGRNLLSSKGIDHVNYIRAKMREIGRLLLKVREKGAGKDNISVKDMLKPNMFDLVIECIHSVCSYISQKDQCPKYETPSLALKIGHTLRKCAYLKQSTSIKSSDKEAESEAESFLKLMDIEYTPKVSAIALSTLNTQRQRNVKPLPVTEDIVKFSSFITSRMTSLCDDLNTADTDSFQTVYHSLVKVTAAQIITFNKRRSGEVAKMLITDFTQRTEARNEGTSDVFKMLSKPEQKLSERLDLMHIKGKRGRIVPIILTKDTAKALQHLVNMTTRKKAGVDEDNNYAFPLSRSSKNNIRGCDALAEVVKDANLNHPETFKSTNLRKYVATVSQVLNMKENEIDWLASHLGHNINVHRHFYRLQEQHVELAKIAKLLLAVDQGKTHLCAGKSLNDLPIEDIRDVQYNDFDEDNDDEGVVDDEDDGVVDHDGNAEGACLSASEEENEIGPSVDRDHPENRKEYGGKRRSPKTGKSCRHRPWTTEEKNFVLQEFHNTIRKGNIVGVGKKLIEEKIGKGGDLLKQRTWVQVKSCIKNIIDKNKKEDLKMERRKLFMRK